MSPPLESASQRASTGQFQLLSACQLLTNMVDSPDWEHFAFGAQEEGGAAGLAGHQQQVVSSIRGMWATSTWVTRAGLMRRFANFRASHNMQADRPEVVDWAIPLFVESTGVEVTGKLAYAKQLAAIFQRWR